MPLVEMIDIEYFYFIFIIYMSSVNTLEGRKESLKRELVGSKRETAAIIKASENVDGINCAEIKMKCKKRKVIATKYRKKLTEKRREVNSEIKDINARIKAFKQSKKRRRCPNGSRKNSKTNMCVKISDRSSR
jgi:hypothetical protein